MSFTKHEFDSSDSSSFSFQLEDIDRAIAKSKTHQLRNSHSLATQQQRSSNVNGNVRSTRSQSMNYRQNQKYQQHHHQQQQQPFLHQLQQVQPRQHSTHPPPPAQQPLYPQQLQALYSGAMPTTLFAGNNINRRSSPMSPSYPSDNLSALNTGSNGSVSSTSSASDSSSIFSAGLLPQGYQSQPTSLSSSQLSGFLRADSPLDDMIKFEQTFNKIGGVAPVSTATAGTTNAVGIEGMPLGTAGNNVFGANSFSGTNNASSMSSSSNNNNYNVNFGLFNKNIWGNDMSVWG